ncbi:hypothetical protein L6164_023545 [Bauhinia variegata]|uniref:Uncharacterized protein n=1 Tax=Bauhinia variegata TaxID=167791 RepID=A0ACB9MIY8_BAUVA|nr:hypothetical protein L6164_023545 [Bauhinia variegata]
MGRLRNPNGHRKIKIKKRSKDNNLQVTFSNGQNGLSKKASELFTLFAVEAALIIFSPGNKVFPFGHPSVDYVINSCLPGALPQTSSFMRVIKSNLTKKK